MIREEESVTIKKSAMVLQMELKRSKGGILVNVKADRAIEDLFREWGAGMTNSVNQHGRLWKPVGGAPLSVYQLNVLPNGGAHLNSDAGPYNLSRTGTLLLDDHGINLGFLRLVGISEGVTFTIEGVYSANAIREMRSSISVALKNFYVNFLKPVDIVLTISATEV